jgi:tetratricopeptide (TPR) repeat protein
MGWLAVVGVAAGVTLAVVAVPRPAARQEPATGDATTPLDLGTPAPGRTSDAAGVVPDSSNAPPAEAGRAFMTEIARGQVAFDGGRFEEALVEFRAALAADPSNALAANHAGQALMRLGRTEEAIDALQQAVALAPSRWDFNFNLARALGAASRWEAAAAAYRRALAERPDSYPTVFNLAQALEKSGDRAGALAQYRAGAELAPLEPTFRLGVATLAEQAGDMEQARTAYREYLELAPEGSEADRVRSRLERLDRAAAGT